MLSPDFKKIIKIVEHGNISPLKLNATKNTFHKIQKFIPEYRNNNIKKLEKNLNINNTSSNNAHKLALIKEVQLQYKESERFYEKAIEMEYKNLNLYQNMALMFLNAEKYMVSYACFSSILNTKSTNDVDIISYMGDAQGAMKNYDCAIKLYNRSLRAGGNKVKEFNKLGKIWHTAGDSKVAIHFLKKSLEINNKNDSRKIETLNSLGNAYVNIDQKTGLKYFKHAAKMEKEIHKKSINFAIYTNHLASVYFKMGDYENAFIHYTQALKIFKRFFNEKYFIIKNILDNIETLKEHFTIKS